MDSKAFDTEDIDKMFRRVFGNMEGQRVLTWILRDLGYGKPIEPGNVGQATLKNYAERLLDHCGVLRDERLDRVVSKMFEIPPPWSTKDEPAGEEGAHWGKT